MADLNSTLMYNSVTIPPEIFVIIFIASLVFLLMSFFIKNKPYKIMCASTGTIMAFFSLYACFVLGWTTTAIPEMATQMIGDVTYETVRSMAYYTEVITSKPLIYLMMGNVALNVFNLIITVFKYSEEALVHAVKENPEIRNNHGIYQMESHKYDE